MTKKKMMMAGMSAALVAVIGVGGTLAYLSAQSDVVENVFTVGAGFVSNEDGKGIVLNETYVDPETGEVLNETLKTTRNVYADLLPNDTRKKDPTVSLVTGSVDSYVFVKISGLDELAENGVEVTDFNVSDWARVLSDGTGNDGIYMYQGTIATDDLNSNGDGVISVRDNEEGKTPETVELSTIFEGIHVDKDMTQEKLDQLNKDEYTGKIDIQAVAVQADNNTPEDALTEAKNVAQW